MENSFKPKILNYCCCCSVTQLYPALYDPMHCSTPGFSVLYYLPEFAQTHVHWVSDAIQPSHPLLPPFPPVVNLSQHQGLFLVARKCILSTKEKKHASKDQYYICAFLFVLQEVVLQRFGAFLFFSQLRGGEVNEKS